MVHQKVFEVMYMYSIVTVQYVSPRIGLGHYDCSPPRKKTLCEQKFEEGEFFWTQKLKGRAKSPNSGILYSIYKVYK
jgi:hypothetical protein